MSAAIAAQTPLPGVRPTGRRGRKTKSNAEHLYLGKHGGVSLPYHRAFVISLCRACGCNRQKEA